MGIYKNKNVLTAAGELRCKAEKQLKAKPPEKGFAASVDEPQRLVHELHVHQIELEMQNAELRQIRDELEMSLDKYTDLYDFAPVGYFSFDKRGVILSVNLTGAGLLGIDRDRLTGMNFGQLVVVTGRPLFTQFLRNLFESSEKSSCEVELIHGGMNPLIVKIEAAVDSSIQESRAVIHDISARRQMEDKLEVLHTDLAAHAAKLEAANIELEAFNYSVSHDLRSPLSTINSYCQVIQEQYGASLDEDCLGFIREMYDGTLRMNRLIDTLLDFSRISSVELVREQIDLSMIATESALWLKHTAPQRQVTFNIAEGIIVDGDAALLRLVLDNLIGNAWKYSINRDKTVIEFGETEVAGGKACFVRDNGPGFAMEEARELFVPFKRLPGTTVAGTGIGLATVERIIRRHGGKVWAESAPDKGATFLFTLKPFGRPV